MPPFSLMQGEIVALRQAVEALPAILARVTRATDYTLTLGTTVKVRTPVEARAVAIQDHPALKMTPEQHGRAIGRAGADAFVEAARVMRDEADALKRERSHLAGIVEGALDRAAQRQRQVWEGAMALWSASVRFRFYAPRLHSPGRRGGCRSTNC